MTTRRMHDLTWERFRDLVPGSIDLVLIPVGTIEAHGAIPLGTDTAIPEAMAVSLAERLGALIAPAIPYGVTNTLLPYPGSTTVSPAAFRTYLFEAAAGLVERKLGVTTRTAIVNLVHEFIGEGQRSNN